ncbi:MoxR family ATPase [Actinoplanes sp. NPDC023801]|uniref:AAA family ATPase n=1 Tax=Actinoplanes sp. NPDC023801 TaxID=3154595 RepID=UPI0033CC12A7
MRSRHEVDTTTRFNREWELPDERLIEVAGTEPIAETDPVTETVTREPYIADPDLEEAVNVAIALGRPLLLQGDPGAGKTRLAYAVSYALGLPLEEAYIKSTSRGQELLYTYDAVRRLYEIQSARGSGARPVEEPDKYVRLGPLGRAIARAAYGRRSVVLIDEIDKADIDFPNDLLRELDQLKFEVPEVPGLSYAVPAGRPELRPIVIVTNNEEKTLPPAFLRRCVFHYVRFPSRPEELDSILELHGIRRRSLRKQTITTLLSLRELDLGKPPGLSELLDWVGYLQAVDAGNRDIERLAYSGALVKQHTDQARVTEWLAGR